MVNDVIKKGCFPFTVLSVVLVFVLWRKCSYANFKSVEFSGNIDSIWYDDKGDPAVTIKKQFYRLTFGRDDLKVNDSLVKRKNSFVVKQYRNGKFIEKFVWGE